eukprot:3678972-Alexandrium_andersonii.AAC.1
MSAPPNATDGDNAGIMEPFDEDSYKKSMSVHGRYCCGCNAFWANVFWSSQSGVPINPTTITKYME